MARVCRARVRCGRAALLTLRAAARRAQGRLLCLIDCRRENSAVLHTDALSRQTGLAHHTTIYQDLLYCNSDKRTRLFATAATRLSIQSARAGSGTRSMTVLRRPSNDLLANARKMVTAVGCDGTGDFRANQFRLSSTSAWSPAGRITDTASGPTAYCWLWPTCARRASMEARRYSDYRATTIQPRCWLTAQGPAPKLRFAGTYGTI
jgi:hypothetical protein